jgi:hypothetical protein
MCTLIVSQQILTKQIRSRVPKNNCYNSEASFAYSHMQYHGRAECPTIFSLITLGRRMFHHIRLDNIGEKSLKPLYRTRLRLIKHIYNLSTFAGRELQCIGYSICTLTQTSTTTTYPSVSAPKFFLWRGPPDPEAIYKLCLILKTML